MNHSFICGRGERFFSSSKMLRPLSDPPILLLSGYWGARFLRVHRVWGIQLSTHIHLLLWLRMHSLIYLQGVGKGKFLCLQI